MILVAYTDASYCQNSKIAISGHYVLLGGTLYKHDLYVISDVDFSTYAEVMSVVLTMDLCMSIPGLKSVIIYTDCDALLKTKRKEKNKSFVDLRLEFDKKKSIIESMGIIFQLRHVKGHSGHKYNTLIDVSCRKCLRLWLKK